MENSIIINKIVELEIFFIEKNKIIYNLIKQVSNYNELEQIVNKKVEDVYKLKNTM